jgi:hypothetical protein
MFIARNSKFQLPGFARRAEASPRITVLSTGVIAKSPLFMPVFHNYLRKTRIKSGEKACNNPLLM